MLKPQEKQVAFLHVVRRLKLEVIASEMAISRSRVKQLLTSIYRVLGVEGQIELAFEMGRNWKELEEEFRSLVKP